MGQHGKKYLEAAKLIDRTQAYGPSGRFMKVNCSKEWPQYQAVKNSTL